MRVTRFRQQVIAQQAVQPDSARERALRVNGGVSHSETMNYFESFILLAPDSTATCASVPPLKGEAQSIPSIEHELLSTHPYSYTQEELQFAVYLRREGISEIEAKAKRKELWAQFSSKPHACLRGSSLQKKYGWGLHFNSEGKIALIPAGSLAYKKFSGTKSIKTMPAFRSKRA